VAPHRGMQKSDLILGPFAELYVPDFDTARFDRFLLLPYRSESSLASGRRGRGLRNGR
jgi:succinate dehydrogenase flavin-adding protein (antitoxin of CptAB toxin-antitoxin module)